MSNNVAPYPLHWPDGVKRTPYRQQPKFGDLTVDQGVRELAAEIHKIRGVVTASVVISSNLVYGRTGSPPDPGVAVYFNRMQEISGERKSVPYQLACDRWQHIKHNLRALAKHIEALRGMERWGVGTLEQAFAGYAALPPPGGSKIVVTRPWFEVLGVFQSAPIEVAEAAYRALAKSAHPDQGGSLDRMAELNAAIAEAREAKR